MRERAFHWMSTVSCLAVDFVAVITYHLVRSWCAWLGYNLIRSWYAQLGYNLIRSWYVRLFTLSPRHVLAFIGTHALLLSYRSRGVSRVIGAATT